MSVDYREGEVSLHSVAVVAFPPMRCLPTITLLGDYPGVNVTVIRRDAFALERPLAKETDEPIIVSWSADAREKA